jgi:hypothetical protein
MEYLKDCKCQKEKIVRGVFSLNPIKEIVLSFPNEQKYQAFCWRLSILSGVEGVIKNDPNDWKVYKDYDGKLLECHEDFKDILK